MDARNQLPLVLASDDGRTIVSVRRSNRMARVINARTGRVRATFRIPVEMEIAWLGLSRDGSLLFGPQSFVPQDPNHPETWYAARTTDGGIVSRIALTHPCCAPTLYDPALGRLFTLEAAAQTDPNVEPGPPRIVAYDVASGRLVRSLTLDGVRYGGWRTGTASNGEPTYMYWAPGFALSPDGRRLATFDVSSGRLTLIDGNTNQVLNREIVSFPTSSFQRLMAWLGVAPTVASAKESRGANLEMRYSPDGRFLYLTGYEYLPGANAKPHTIGIRTVNVSTRQIVGQSLKGRELLWTQSSPDGRAVFTLSAMDSGTYACPCVLRRHNPTNLRVVAKKLVLNFVNPQYFVLRAAALRAG